MNRKSNLSKIIIIIICFILVIAVSISKIVQKEHSSNEPSTVQIKDTILDTSMSPTTESPTETSNESLDQYVEGNQFNENTDTSLYEDDASDTYGENIDNETSIFFSNPSIFTDLEGSYLGVLEELDSYIKENKINKNVGQVDVDMKTFILDQDKKECKFTCDLLNGYKLNVEINLNDYTYKIDHFSK